MSINLGFASGALPTGTTTGDPLDITFGSGFGTPVFVWIQVSGGVTAATEIGSDPFISYGMTDMTNQICHAYGMEARSAANERGWTIYSSADLFQLNNKSGVGSNGTAAFGSAITDGVRLTIGTPPTKAYGYAAFAINGGGSQAFVGTKGTIGAGFSSNITSPGFQPNVVIALGHGLYSGTPAWTNGALSSVGFAVDHPSGIQNCHGSWWSKQAVDPTETALFITDAYCTSKLNSGTTGVLLGHVSAFLSTGFEMTNDDVDSASVGMGYAALRLPNLGAWAGVMTTPASTGLKTFTEPNFVPQGWMVVENAATVLNTIQTSTSSSSMGVGIAAGRTSTGDFCAQVREADNVINPYSPKGLFDNQIANVMTDVGTTKVVANFSSWGSQGPVADFTNVATTGAQWPSLIFGSGKSLVMPRRRAIRHLIGR